MMRNRWRISAVLVTGVLICAGWSRGFAGEVPAACTGDCDEDGNVVVSELIRAVNVALGSADRSACPAIDRNDDGTATVDELVAAVRSALVGCFPVTPAPTLTPTPTRRPTFDEPLGVRHFSLDPMSSGFSIVGLPIPLGGTGFEGWIELEAGKPDPETGIADVNVIGASEYLSVLVTPQFGPPIAVCLRPLREQFPIRNAGLVSCYGGFDLGFTVIQNHNIGTVGVDGFTAADCRAAGGDVEPEDGAHPGVCNGPLVPGQPGGDSGPGAVVIAPTADTRDGGFPVVLALESALPCGDEGVAGISAPLGLTTGVSIATVLNRNNTAGNVLDVQERGENFSCETWAEEDGPGRLVFAAPLLDLDTGVIGFFDLGNVFVFDD